MHLVEHGTSTSTSYKSTYQDDTIIHVLVTVMHPVHIHWNATPLLGPTNPLSTLRVTVEREGRLRDLKSGMIFALSRTISYEDWWKVIEEQGNMTTAPPRH